MIELTSLLMLNILAGGISGLATAAMFIASRQRELKDQALEFRKSARRLETAIKIGQMS